MTFQVTYSDFPSILVGSGFDIILGSFDITTMDQLPDFKVTVLTPNDGISHYYVVNMAHTIWENDGYYGGIRNDCHWIGVVIENVLSDGPLDPIENWADTSGFNRHDPPPGPQAFLTRYHTMPPNTYVTFHFRATCDYPPFFNGIRLIGDMFLRTPSNNNIVEAIIEMN